MFISGILKSKWTFTKRLVEVRIERGCNKCPDLKTVGLCSSFLLYSDFDKDKSENEVIYFEIDVVELQKFDCYEEHQDHINNKDSFYKGYFWIGFKKNVSFQANKIKF